MNIHIPEWRLHAEEQESLYGCIPQALEKWLDSSLRALSVGCLLLTCLDHSPSLPRSQRLQAKLKLCFTVWLLLVPLSKQPQQPPPAYLNTQTCFQSILHSKELIKNRGLLGVARKAFCHFYDIKYLLITHMFRKLTKYCSKHTMWT